MISRYAWYIREAFKKVWVRVVGFAALAFLSAGLAQVLSPYLPEAIALQTGSEAVAQLLGILTSSMLAVTTFSLSIAVSAFAAAAGSATPRATVLLQQDRTTQNVLATFLGAFLFGLVGLIALYAGLYDTAGKIVIFLFTVAVIGLVVVAMIRWIGHLMEFGRMGDTLDRIEQAASQALHVRLENPYLGGQPLHGAPPENCIPVTSDRTGYIQHIDMQALQRCAERGDVRVFVRRLPGAFISGEGSLLFVEAESIEDELMDAFRRAYAIGTTRTFEEDPRFGIIVLSEIASRALSPAVNDPGTAIDILARHLRILTAWREQTDTEIQFENIFVSPIAVADVIEDAFRPIARDGASLSEVQIRLQKVLASLRQSAPEIFSPPCDSMAREALERAEAASLLASEMKAIRSAASSEDRFPSDNDGSRIRVGDKQKPEGHEI